MTMEVAQFHEDPDQMRADIDCLKEWLQKQPHIHGRTDDEFLMRFIRGCKYSLERAKEKIDTYYTMRTAAPEFFTNRDTMNPIVQEILRLGILLPLGRDAQGRRFMVVRAGLVDPARIPAESLTHAHTMLMELIMEDDGDKIGQGHGALFDMKGVTLAHIIHFTPAFCKKTLQVYQNSFPLRPQSIQYMNVLPVMETFLILLRSIFNEKLRERILVHKNLESVHAALPKEILPEEYGGTAGTAEEIAEHWRVKMVAKRDYFLDDEQYRVDERKRPGKPKTYEDIFGLEGSFRRLSVD